MISRRDDDRDVLQELEDLFQVRGEVFPRGRAAVYVADPVLAREVLANRSGDYREHSDFFGTSSGIFGPRAAQVAVGRAVRLVLQDHLNVHAASVPGLVARAFAPASYWPDAANHLMYTQFGPALLGPGTPEEICGLVGQVVHRTVLAGARSRYSPPARIMFRRKVTRALTGEVIARRNGSGGSDVLGVIVRAAPADADPGQLAEVFLSCLFAVTGAAGFVVAWSVYMLVTHPQELGVPPSRIVREALRLWPVAWLFGRRPAAPLELGGIAVTPRHEVVVCSYLAQRHPAYWAEPDEFSPQRWAGTDDNTGYLPFGWGPHSCTGAATFFSSPNS